MPAAIPATPGKVPAIRNISLADIAAAFREGLNDFRRAPLYGLFFGGIYAAGGILLWLILAQMHALWLILPFAVGFPLIGPFVAAGCYEVSRRLERGQPLSFPGVIGFIFAQRERELGWMAFVVLFIFWVWMYQVRLWIALFFGLSGFSSLSGFITLVTGTAQGLTFLAVGTLIGAALAFVLFSATVVAMPLLMDRELDFVTAMITSFKAVLANPLPMLAFGLAIAGLTALALAPFFLGLLIVLPVAGHATWHLYRRITGS